MSGVNDEAQLIRRVVERQSAAEDEFIQRYRGVVLGLARGRLSLFGEAGEELWQETMAKLWQEDCRALRAWRGQGRFSTYLTVIVTHLALKRRQQVNRRLEDGMEDLPEEPMLDEPSVDERLAQRQEHVGVQRAIKTLSARDRLLLALRFADERTPQEISGLLGQAPGTVRKALHDALGRLRRRLEDTQETASPRRQPKETSDRTARLR